MPLFQRDKQKLEIIKPKKFSNEKELQTLIEFNLEEMFNCRFVATEFSTGPVHGGRIDSLALSEENNPVIKDVVPYLTHSTYLLVLTFENNFFCHYLNKKQPEDYLNGALIVENIMCEDLSTSALDKNLQ